MEQIKQAEQAKQEKTDRKKILDIAIIGTGGIGGYYGARLAHGGHRVHFLLHTEYDYVRTHGLTVDSCYGDFSLEHPLVYNDVRDMPPCDLICVCVKATANEAVFRTLTPILKTGTGAAAATGQGPGAGATDILLLQNGFGYEQALGELYPDHAVYGGMCFICSFRDGPGVIRHISYGKVTLAALDPDNTDGLAGLAKVFTDEGIGTETINDLLTGRWRKLVWNIPYNGLCVIMDCKTDFLATDPDMRAAVRAIMEEILAAAEACGTNIPAGFVDEMILSTDNMPPYEPSMRLDHLAGRPLETEAIYGKVIAFAAGHGFDMKYAKLIKWQLDSMSK
ncbi:MAG: 2-dehydropantoate 2-reductase [Clostridiales Family XIII bacterium]|jgi:2-dehydropantoate 2-reductase|nr:2-dehydropantoate 2-reductase [Clostridiales Family XIII bacterium]